MAGVEFVSEILRESFANEVIAVEPAGVHPHITLKPERWHEVALFLRDDDRVKFNWLRCLAAVDHLEDKRFTLVYELHSAAAPETATQSAIGAGAVGPPDPRSPIPLAFWRVRHELSVRLHIDRAAPHIASVADIWPAANWHEREAFDLFGIIFDGHPDLRRILCCDDWVGYPLRKDYEFPLEYHGIPGTTELAQSRIEH